MKTIKLFFLSLLILLIPAFHPANASLPALKHLHEFSAVTSAKPAVVRAQLCNNCGFGNKKDNCCKCGKWVACNGVPARLCNDCGFGNKKDNCVKCGKWVANNGVPAQLCNDCGFGNKKENCAKCGKWAPN